LRAHIFTKADGAGIDGLKPGDQAQQRALAAAAAADDGDELPCRNVQVDAAQHLVVSERFAQGTDGERKAAGGGFRPSPQQPRLFDDKPVAANIECKFGDSTKFDISAYRGKAEFIFIDGGHDAPVVTSDTLKALEMVTPDGMIVWHDYRDFKGVQEAIAVAVRRKGDANFRFIRDTSMVAYQPAGFG